EIDRQRAVRQRDAVPAQISLGRHGHLTQPILVTCPFGRLREALTLGTRRKQTLGSDRRALTLVDVPLPRWVFVGSVHVPYSSRQYVRSTRSRPRWCSRGARGAGSSIKRSRRSRTMSSVA